MATEKRLIDARFLTSQMYMICEVCQTENIFIDAIIDEIDNAPTVDAVPVVRCKGCRYYEPPEDGDSLGVCKNGRLCVSNMGEVYPLENYYCPYGERKDNGAV